MQLYNNYITSICQLYHDLRATIFPSMGPGMAAECGMWTHGPWDGLVTCKEGWRHMFKTSFGPWFWVTFAIICHFCNSIDQWYAMLCNDGCASKFYHICISMRKQYAISGTMLHLLQLLQLLHNFLIIFCFFNYYIIIG